MAEPVVPVAAPSAPAAAPAKVLVIAEKRSVGRTLAAFLGCRDDHGSWIGGDAYDVSWAQGHLLRLLMPDEYDDRPAWRERGTAALPIVPDAGGWRWEVSRERGADAQFQTLSDLVRSGRYARIVNACDPDREGQCIADLALWFMGCALPVDRLWCSSLEDEALAKAFVRLKPNAAYAGLFQSAVARSQADWLVGMNASRLYSSSMRSAQSVGRVRTPTLALVVERDRQIEAFRSSTSYKVRLDLGDGLTVTGEAYADEAEAARVLAAARGAACSIDAVERKRCREGAPTLLNTTGAQKLASERLGMAPDAVDHALQALYEKKLATYPRTDSRYVNTEDAAALPGLAELVADADHVGERAASASAGLPRDFAKVVDDAKVEGHGALLPTMQLTSARLAALPDDEAAVARLLCESLLVAVAPDRVFDRTAVKATCQGLPYTASATADVERGWKRLRPTSASSTPEADDARSRIPADLAAPAERAVCGGEVRAVKAQPPKRFTDATLLAAMEHAERFVEVDELKAAIKDSSLHSGGIGTPATRAGIIASLVDRGYLARKGSSLRSTAEGRALVDEVAPELKSVELTARMERDLTAIANDGADPSAFVAGVAQLVRTIVASQLARAPRTAVPTGTKVGRCPACGAAVVDTGREQSPYLCENVRRERVCNEAGEASWRDCGTCTFRLYRTYLGKKLTKTDVAALLSGKTATVKGLVSQRDGQKFEALVALDPERGFRPRIVGYPPKQASAQPKKA